MMNRKWLPLLLPLLACLTLCGCFRSSGPPNALYTLHAAEDKPLGNFAGFTEMIVVMPARLAPQLQGLGLLYQRSANEAQSAARHLWAGPLDQQIAENIADNLKILLATPNTAVFPGPRFGVPRYQVEVEVREFGGDLASFRLSAVYTVSDAQSRTIIARKDFRQRFTNNPAGYSGYVASASKALGALSREIAAALIDARRASDSGQDRR